MVDELGAKAGFGNEIFGYILSSVQLGFIIGTLVFALLMIADRFSPSRVFMFSAFLAAFCNLGVLFTGDSQALLLIARFGTGFFLAGIYPVGMKIAADYYEQGLGKALGLLVGALVLGKSFPYFIKGAEFGQNYETVITAASAMAVIGGILLWILVKDGPYRKPSIKLKLEAGPALFRISGFRKAAIGYFGHMWELYAFWGFLAYALSFFNQSQEDKVSVAVWTFVIIALGGISCFIGGYFSLKYGSLRVARTALALSGICCLLSPLFFELSPAGFLFCFAIWGMAVTADSPQFSSLVANSVVPELKGTGLTMVNSIGFAISIVSIELLSALLGRIDGQFLFLVLVPGPLLGLWQLFRRKLH